MKPPSAPFFMLAVSLIAVGYLSAMTVLSCSTPSPPLPDRELLDTTASTTPDETLPEAGGADGAAPPDAYEVNTGACPGTCCPGSCGTPWGPGTAPSFGGHVLR